MLHTPRFVLILGALILAPLSPALAQPGAFTFYGDSAYDYFGSAVSGAGDVDADGFPDFIVGAPQDDNNGISSGSVRVHSGKDGQIIYAINGDFPNVVFGGAVAGAGDINQDGHADFIVGANGPFGAGGLKALNGKGGQVLTTIVGASSGDALGRSVASAGDVNNDGSLDIAADAPGTGTDNGAVFVYSGTDWSVLHTIPGDSGDSRLGEAVGGLGDINGDGNDDFMARAEDSVKVYSGADGSIVHDFQEKNHGAAPAGDIDGDGIGDIVVANSQITQGAFKGRIVVYSGLNKSIILTAYGDESGNLGGAVAGAGDVNGDGHGDIAVLSYKGVRVVSGKGGYTMYKVVGDSPGDSLGQSIAGVGDVDLDGKSDFMAGAPYDDDNGMNSGSARVFTNTDGIPFVGYAPGCVVGSDLNPHLTMYGAPTPGGSVVMSVDHAPPWAFSMLFVGLTETSIPAGCGCALNVGSIVAQIPFAITGSGDFSTTFPLHPAIGTGTAKLQAFIAEPASACGHVSTNGLSVTVE